MSTWLQIFHFFRDTCSQKNLSCLHHICTHHLWRLYYVQISRFGGGGLGELLDKWQKKDFTTRVHCSSPISNHKCHISTFKLGWPEFNQTLPAAMSLHKSSWCVMVSNQCPNWQRKMWCRHKRCFQLKYISSKAPLSVIKNEYFMLMYTNLYVNFQWYFTNYHNTLLYLHSNKQLNETWAE